MELLETEDGDIGLEMKASELGKRTGQRLEWWLGEKDREPQKEELANFTRLGFRPPRHGSPSLESLRPETGKFAHLTRASETGKSRFRPSKRGFLDLDGFKPKRQIWPRNSRHQNQLWQFGVAWNQKRTSLQVWYIYKTKTYKISLKICKCYRSGNVHIEISCVIYCFTETIFCRCEYKISNSGRI